MEGLGVVVFIFGALFLIGTLEAIFKELDEDMWGNKY